MDEQKVPFAFNWAPQKCKVVTVRQGTYRVSPIFLTVYQRVVFKWRLIFYPNGEYVSVKADPASQFDGLEFGSAIFLQLVECSQKKRALRVQAEVDFDIKCRCDCKFRWVNKFSVSFRCAEKIDKNPLDGKKGLDSFGPRLELHPSSFIVINRGRMIIRCRLLIPVESFVQFQRQTRLDKVIDKNFYGKILEVSKANLKEETDKIGRETDIIFESSDKEEFPCHFSIVSSKSEVLKSMFNSKFKEGEMNRAVLHDFNGETLGEFLTYLYSGCFSLQIKTLSIALYYAADKYMVENLKPFCVRMMEETVTTENVWSMLRAAELFGLKALERKALETVVTNTSRVLKSEECQQMAKDNPRDILGLMKSALRCASNKALRGGDFGGSMMAIY